MNAIHKVLRLIVLVTFVAIIIGSTPLTQPDIYYVCVMPSSDVSGLPASLETFAKAHGMSFRAGPLNPEGTAMAIELKGKGATIFVTNNTQDRELYITIERSGSRPRNVTNLAILNKDILEQIKKLRPLIVEWRRLPENYIPAVPAAAQALRGPAL